MACKAYRDRFYERIGGYSSDIIPEILACDTVHCAFDKAAHLLGMKMISIPADEKTRKFDLARAKALVSSSRTALIVGSSPCFSHGVIDDISELAALASSYGVGMHVDACLGSFLVPFAEKLGYDIPKVCFFLIRFD